MRLPLTTLCLTLPVLAQGAYAPRPDLEEGRFLKALAEAEAQLKLNHSHALAWAAKSHALSALLRFSEALDCAQRALALNHRLADAYLARGLARGGYAIQQRNFGSLRKATGAMDDLRRATELDPTLAPAWMSLGLAYQQMPGILGGSTKKALKCAEALRRVRPERGDLLQGMILSLEKRWKEAEPYFSRALSTGSSDPQVVAGYLEALGSRETREAMGEGTQKARLVQEARRFLPQMGRSAKGMEAISDALLDGGQPEEAWDTAQKALNKADSPSILHLTLGKISAKSGLHRESGLGHLDIALNGPLEGGSGGYATVWWRKGQILRDLNRDEDARLAVLNALEIEPKHPASNRLLKLLEK